MYSSAENAEKKLFLLDAFALIYRSYYAFIKTPRFTSTGINTSAMLGFTNTLLELIEKEKPSHMAVVFDPEGPTFRHKMYKEYKAHRPPMPDDLKKSIPYIKKIIQAFNIAELSINGFEADDVIGSLAKLAEKKGYTTYMVTPDKDYAQLVSEHIFMYKPKRSGREVEVWGIPEVQENFGVKTSQQVIDILGLMGDASDNIPGCPGIGAKTAQKLIGLYQSIDGVYENTNSLKGKQKERIVDSEEQVRFSRELATIALNAPIEFDERALKLKHFDEEKLAAIFKELEFFSLHERVFKKQQTSLNLQENKDTSQKQEEKKIPKQKKLNTQYFVLHEQQAIASLKAELSMQNQFAFKFVYANGDANVEKIIGIAFSFKNDKAFFVPFPKEPEKAKKLAREFSLIFGDEQILKIGHNCKKDILAFRNLGVELKAPIFDTQVAHYLLFPEQNHSFSVVAKLFLHYELAHSDETAENNQKSQLSLNLEEEPVKYDIHCKEVAIALELKAELEKQLKSNNLKKLFCNMEMPLLHILANMEFYGVSVDVPFLKNYALVLNKEAALVETEIKTLAGIDFNVSSPKQLGEVLFEKLKLDSKAKKTKSGQYSTSEAILSKLSSKHEIIQKVLDFRSLKKLISTYLEALPTYINKETGKIHTSFHQTETATGRLSSVRPNLQNIPIKTKQGRLIRKAFIPSSEDHVFLSADYSQIELRLMAHMSKDENMIEAFLHDADFHKATAAKIYKIPIEQVNSEMRSRAKTANFGIIYGISAWGLAERLKISRTEGKALISGYFESFPKVKAFMDESIEKARKNEFVNTIMGRKRHLKDINSSNAIVRGVAERNAINAPIQGSAADVIKIAMINIEKRMKKEGMKSKMIIQVHDELNFDCLKTELETMKIIVQEEMENAVQLLVPLTVDMGTGENWLEAH